jgi:hypothetical protein
VQTSLTRKTKKTKGKSTNKQHDAGIDESDEEEKLPGSSKQAKAIQKLIRKREGNDAYESDGKYTIESTSLFSSNIFSGRRTTCRVESDPHQQKKALSVLAVPH